MKAYKTDDNRVVMFRPKENMKRMARSAERACLPVNILISVCFKRYLHTYCAKILYCPPLILHSKIVSNTINTQSHFIGYFC